MTNYIKAITVAATATAAAEFVLIPVDGVTNITFGGSPGSSHIMNINYMMGTGSAGTNGRNFLVNVAIPDANTTSVADLTKAFHKAMAAALQTPGSLPLLLENDTVITSAAIGSAAL
jgi:hypothetical protein